MNIYKLSIKHFKGYDTYDSFVVQAKTKESAFEVTQDRHSDRDWTTEIDGVDIDLVGVSFNCDDEKIISSSFNAG